MKALLFLPLLVMSVWITGCTKKYEYVTPNQTIQTTIQKADWQLTDVPSYAVTLSMPEITDQVNQDFGVSVYISADGETFEAIPEVYGGYSYSYTYTTGSLTIEAQDVSGSSAGAAPDKPIIVKIVLVESEP
ncbi:MAG TPA: hypothetical protein VFS25_18570 [Chitinophaga sp.]|uniref:hypothetical protein n=1 Tax=Chitinophaga sp. TaxID=1869181 RepID=UPI002DBDB8A0|nr:hypothetical protein [Chitinophaga sp.]HEU4554860.1 hypothetical protein [Chitinophaga sp.]